mmetsp:Transcript_15022/g.38606  ORF Transcript_15022/g.38606 Transcript_15022/m.38606 type:complete len:264 (+) Transcript_15022:171-962(+)
MAATSGRSFWATAGVCCTLLLLTAPPGHAEARLAAPRTSVSSAPARGITSRFSRLPAHAAPELPLLAASSAPGAVEQVHIQAGSNPEGVIISWSIVPDAEGNLPAGSCTTVLVWASDSAPELGQCSRCEVPESGAASATGSLAYARSAAISGLSASTEFNYEIPGINSSFRGTFTTSPRTGSRAITFGVVGDVGQTLNSQQTLSHIHELKNNMDMIIHAGDISYADGYEPRWDSYGRCDFMQPYMWSHCGQHGAFLKRGEGGG